MSVASPSGVCHCVTVWLCCRTQPMKYSFQLIDYSMFTFQLFESNNLSFESTRLEHGKVLNSKLFEEAKTDSALGEGDFEVYYQTSRSGTKRRNPEVQKLS